MTRKLCSAGVRGSYSYVILDTKDGIISQIHDTADDDEIVATHLDMEIAEKWTEHKLETLMAKRQYETD